MKDTIGDYIASLADKANKEAAMHGGNRRWWKNHDRSKCKACGGRPDRVIRRMFTRGGKLYDRLARTNFEKRSFENG